VQEKEAKAMANQITTAATERLRERMGVLSPGDLRALEDAILLHLGIRR
jgi:mRNA-degrading endonuclease toxin of MazEF toxin-antitoxin module